MQFSIITPSFRPGPWLPLCVASVADQQGVEVEHVVQDAGSDDGTLDWLRADRRVQAFVEKDEGMYDAINRGLRRARGELLGYLNCDEQYLPGALGEVARFFAANPKVEVLFGDAVLVDAAGQPLSYRRMVLPKRGHVRWVHLNTLTCSTFFRRSLLDRGFFFDPQWKAIGDGMWVDALLAAGVPMAVLPVPLAAFAFTGQNLGATDRARDEAARSQGQSWRRSLAPFYSLAHRLEKWRAGAYRRHALEMSLYTQESPAARVLQKHPGLGFGWPSIGSD